MYNFCESCLTDRQKMLICLYLGLEISSHTEERFEKYYIVLFKQRKYDLDLAKKPIKYICS